MIKELSLAEKKKLCMLSDSQTIYYMIDNKIVTPTPQFSCPSYDEILQTAIKSIANANFTNIQSVSSPKDANCIIQITRKIDSFSMFSWFDFFNFQIYTKLDGKWVTISDDSSVTEIDFQKQDIAFESQYIDNNGNIHVGLYTLERCDVKNFFLSVSWMFDSKKKAPDWGLFSFINIIILTLLPHRIVSYTV